MSRINAFEIDTDRSDIPDMTHLIAKADALMQYEANHKVTGEHPL